MRKPRELNNGAIYHIVARANRGEFILHNPGSKELFIDVLKRAKEKYSFQLKHFCIMSNHVHLLIKPAKNTNLSKIMQWILSVFASKINKFLGLKGHVWYDRFKSKIIKDYTQYVNTFRYISNNPVKAKMCDNSQDYKYSGLKYIFNKIYDLIDSPDSLLQRFIPGIAGLLLE